MEKLSKKFLDTFNRDMIFKMIKRNHPLDNASQLRINSIKNNNNNNIKPPYIIIG